MNIVQQDKQHILLFIEYQMPSHHPLSLAGSEVCVIAERIAVESGDAKHSFWGRVERTRETTKGFGRIVVETYFPEEQIAEDMPPNIVIIGPDVSGYYGSSSVRRTALGINFNEYSDVLLKVRREGGDIIDLRPIQHANLEEWKKSLTIKSTNG